MKKYRRMVYGAGFAGKMMVNYLEICKKVQVEAIVVSNGHKENDSYTLIKNIIDKTIPIIELTEIDGNIKDIMFYITVDKGKEDVIQNVCSAGGEKRILLI